MKTIKKKLSLQLNTNYIQNESEKEHVLSLRMPISKSYIYKISKNLFFGGHCGANDFESLNSSGINVIVNLVSSKLFNSYQRDFLYENFDLVDDFDENLERKLRVIVDTIEKHISEGRNVLVHCRKGLSRAPTVVMAYLIRCKNRKFDSALEDVKSLNPLVDLNFWSEPVLREMSTGC